MNTNKNSYMNRIASSANRFSNFNGDSFGNAPAQQLSQLARTLTVTIVNATTAAANYVVFGYNANGDAASAGSGTGVTVSIAESSHAQVKRDMVANPFVLSGAKYKTSTADSFSNAITYARTPSTGGTNTKIVTPLNYFEPENNQSLIVRINDFNGMVLDGDTALTGSIPAGATITLLLTIGTKVEISNAGTDQSVLVSTNQANPTGIQPILMQVSANQPMIAGPGQTANYIPMK